jgi:hypothetical protein
MCPHEAHPHGFRDDVHVRCKSASMPNKHVVIHSFNMDGDTRCLDIFHRLDGTFGFEEFRRDPEDRPGWFEPTRRVHLVAWRMQPRMLRGAFLGLL